VGRGRRLTCTRERIAFIPWYPLQAGEIVRTDLRQSVKRLLGRDARVEGRSAPSRQRLGATPGQSPPLAWLLRPIAGHAADTGHITAAIILEENVKAADIVLSDADVAALDIVFLTCDLQDEP
jgi:aryl-alcohol dehydrogenase-like predicted oxidoreductase